MDEAAARAWLSNSLGVSRETVDALDAYAALLRTESLRQNLISAATLDSLFARHIVDSAQLVLLATNARNNWLDLGSGAGLPGIVIAIITKAPVVLVESRRLRADWLRGAAEHLGLANVRIEASRLATVQSFNTATLTARAFAPLDRLLPAAHRFSAADTQWILPKGRGAAEELASIADAWHGAFELVASVTDPDSRIIVARDVRPKRMGART